MRLVKSASCNLRTENWANWRQNARLGELRESIRCASWGKGRPLNVSISDGTR